jgi:hypothetical protein
MIWCGLQKSTEDIIADASKAPLWQIILGIVLVSLYAFIAFLNVRDPVHSHTSLASVVRVRDSALASVSFLMLKCNFAFILTMCMRGCREW